MCGSVFTPAGLRARAYTCSMACRKELRATMRRNQSRDRQAMISAAASLPDPLTADLEARMRHRARSCPLCRVRLTDEPFRPNSKELDHIVPRVMGGLHTIGNTRIICRLCNQRRPDDGSDVMQLDLFSSLSDVAVRLARPVLQVRGMNGSTTSRGA